MIKKVFETKQSSGSRGLPEVAFSRRDNAPLSNLCRRGTRKLRLANWEIERSRGEKAWKLGTQGISPRVCTATVVELISTGEIPRRDSKMRVLSRCEMESLGEKRADRQNVCFSSLFGGETRPGERASFLSPLFSWLIYRRWFDDVFLAYRFFWYDVLLNRGDLKWCLRVGESRKHFVLINGTEARTTRTNILFVKRLWRKVFLKVLQSRWIFNTKLLPSVHFCFLLTYNRIFLRAYCFSRAILHSLL